MKPFKFFATEKVGELIWRTGSGRHTPIEWMTTQHIKNVVRCLNGNGEVSIPNPYFGRTRFEWLNIFLSELNQRDETI